jgi:hypothetical protein
MKISISALLSLLLAINAYSQEKLKVYLKTTKDTILASGPREFTQKVTIVVPPQNNLKDAKIHFSILESGLQPPLTEIYLPADRSFKVVQSADTIFKDFYIKHKRNSVDDRIIKIKLSATDVDNKPVELIDSNLTYSLYIKPYRGDTLSDQKKNGYEFWFFTGTNVDLLDGVKLKELYFKGTYLFNVGKKNKTYRNSIYITFGKNRYFTERDSTSRNNFYDRVFKANDGDSITIANGYYKNYRTTSTDNIFASVHYLLKIADLSTEESNFYLNFGFLSSLQTITTKYNNIVIVADTATFLRTGSFDTFRPLPVNMKQRQLSSDISVGITHILSTDKVNVKTFLSGGISFFNYPYVVRERDTENFAERRSEIKAFGQIRLDATVLDPGISIGFETYIRQKQIPLFNVSITKVLDFQKLKGLFSKVEN